MNRRKLLKWMTALPLGGIAAAQSLSDSVTTEQIVEARDVLDAKPIPLKGRMMYPNSYSSIRERHQIELTQWLKRRVDEAAYNMFIKRNVS